MNIKLKEYKHNWYINNKYRDISSMCGFSNKKVLEEIAKCDIVCANCHRIRTHRITNEFH